MMNLVIIILCTIILVLVMVCIFLYNEVYELKQTMKFDKLFSHNINSFKASTKKLLDYTKRYKKLKVKERGINHAKQKK